MSYPIYVCLSVRDSNKNTSKHTLKRSLENQTKVSNFTTLFYFLSKKVKNKHLYYFIQQVTFIRLTNFTAKDKQQLSSTNDT
jgi:hypothetical protein